MPIKVTFTVPGGIDKRKFYRELETQMVKIGRDVAKTYSEFFDSWESRPQMDVSSDANLDRGTAVVEISPKADEGLLQIARWVICGTNVGQPWYRIPKNDLPYPLRYQGVFTPKTQPGIVASQAGGKSGPWVNRWHVYHPGIEPRNTVAVIKDQYREQYWRRMAEALPGALVKAEKPERKG